MEDRLLFPARELKDCAIPVLKRHLKEGQVYFFVTLVGEMWSRQIDNVVFVGRPLQSEGDNNLFFQDMQSYGEGARYGGAWQGRPPVFFSCPETHSSDVFEFERALDLLLLDYPQRPLSSTFGGGIGAGSADWPKATFGSYTGSEEDTEDTDWEESLSDSDKNIRIVWSEQDHPTRPTDPTDEEEQACLAKIPSIHFEARELNPNPEPMTAGSLREGSIYFPVSYADDTRLVPMMKRWSTPARTSQKAVMCCTASKMLTPMRWVFSSVQRSNLVSFTARKIGRNSLLPVVKFRMNQSSSGAAQRRIWKTYSITKARWRNGCAAPFAARRPPNDSAHVGNSTLQKLQRRPGVSGSRNRLFFQAVGRSSLTRTPMRLWRYENREKDLMRK